MPYDYERRVEFHGDAGKALELAKQLFIEKGMKILSVNSEQLQFESPSMLAEAPRSCLRFVSKGGVDIRDSKLTLMAEFGRLKSFFFWNVWFYLPFLPFFFCFVETLYINIVVGSVFALVMVASPCAYKREERRISAALVDILVRLGEVPSEQTARNTKVSEGIMS